MAFAKTKRGTQRITHKGISYDLQSDSWTEIPDEIAPSIERHAGLDLSGRKLAPATPEPSPEKSETEGSAEEKTSIHGVTRRSGSSRSDKRSG